MCVNCCAKTSELGHTSYISVYCETKDQANLLQPPFLPPTYEVRWKVIFILGNVCLFIMWGGGGYPGHFPTGGGVGGGSYSILPDQGCTLIFPNTRGDPIPSQWGVLHLFQWGGVPPSGQWGYPGVPPWDWMGVPPHPSGLDGDTLIRRQSSRASTC